MAFVLEQLSLNKHFQNGKGKFYSVNPLLLLCFPDWKPSRLETRLETRQDWKPSPHAVL